MKKISMMVATIIVAGLLISLIGYSSLKSEDGDVNIQPQNNDSVNNKGESIVENTNEISDISIIEMDYEPVSTPKSEYPFVGELITFFVLDPIEEAEYNWQFGDGSHYDGESEITHVYDYSAFFNIEVKTFINNKWLSDSIEIGISNQDNNYESGRGACLSVQDGKKSGGGTGYTLEQGITIPAISMDIMIQKPYGEITIEVYIDLTDDGIENFDFTYENKSIQATGEDIQYQLDIDTTSDLELSDLPCLFRYNIYVENGFTQYWEVHTNVYY